MKHLLRAVIVATVALYLAYDVCGLVAELWGQP